MIFEQPEVRPATQRWIESSGRRARLGRRISRDQTVPTIVDIDGEPNQPGGDSSATSNT